MLKLKVYIVKYYDDNNSCVQTEVYYKRKAAEKAVTDAREVYLTGVIYEKYVDRTVY